MGWRSTSGSTSSFSTPRAWRVRSAQSGSYVFASVGLANVPHAKLQRQGARAGARAARRLPRMTFEEPSRELQPP
jgi:hypothetical protein